jgi:hypothetical protein
MDVILLPNHGGMKHNVQIQLTSWRDKDERDTYRSEGCS